jgi:hypothetical protein
MENVERKERVELDSISILVPGVYSKGLLDTGDALSHRCSATDRKLFALCSAASRR